MRNKRPVLEYELKKNMLLTSIKVIKPFLIDKHKNLDSKSVYKDLYKRFLKSIDDFENTNNIEYPLAFFFCILLGYQYIKIVSNENLLKSTLSELVKEQNWDNKNISFEVSIYFSYTFFNELYKDIAVDNHLINNSKDTLGTLKSIIEDFSK